MKYRVKKGEKTSEEIGEIKRELLVTPQRHNEYTSVKKIKAYIETENSLYVPMQYGIKKFGKYRGRHCKMDDIEVKFEGKLRDYQEKIVEDNVDKFKEDKPKGVILCIPTGFGKTVIALNMVTKLKKKTLIVVHKEFLMNQWKERIGQFIPDASVGILQGKKAEIENDIVIGMLQSIVSKDYPKEIFEGFGCVVYDETHHMACETFSRAFFKIGTKDYTIGLSATPYRKDGLTKVIEWYIGDVYNMEERGVKMGENSEIKFYNVYYNPVPEDELNVLKKINMPAMVTTMINNRERNEFLVNTIIENMENRKILVLSDRIAHLRYLYQEINQRTIRTVGLYIGKMKEAELTKSNKCDIILGSYNMCSEGYDCPELDTLIMVTPKSDITQSIGRIFRKKHKKPLIIDICDMYSVFKVQGFKRKRMYRKLIPDAKLKNIEYNIGEIEEIKEIDLEFLED